MSKVKGKSVTVVKEDQFRSHPNEAVVRNEGKWKMATMRTLMESIPNTLWWAQPKLWTKMN